MRITARIMAAGECWRPRWPRIDLVKCFPKVDGKEFFDEDEFRRQVKDNPMIQLSSDDKGTPCAFGAILIASVNDWLDDNDKSNDGERTRERIKKRLDRQLERGRVSFVRVDISGKAIEWEKRIVKVAKIKITTDDKGVIEVHKYERDFAMIIADFVRCYSKRYVDRGDPPLMIAEETALLMKELHERTVEAERHERIRKLNGERRFCKSHCHGFCSPPKFDCPCYKNGRCVEVQE